jgi:hypothetical protein
MSALTTLIPDDREALGNPYDLDTAGWSGKFMASVLVTPLLQESLEQKPQSSAANNMKHLLQFPMVMMEVPPPPSARRIKCVSCSSPELAGGSNMVLTATSRPVSLIRQPIPGHCVRRTLISLRRLSAALKKTFLKKGTGTS